MTELEKVFYTGFPALDLQISRKPDYSRVWKAELSTGGHLASTTQQPRDSAIKPVHSML